MAKLTGPLYSIEASGPIGDAVRYIKQRGQNKAVYRQTGTSAGRIGQRRQAIIISEAARLWRTQEGRGPELSYQEYVAGVSADDWLFWFKDVLMEWSHNQLMTLN